MPDIVNSLSECDEPEPALASAPAQAGKRRRQREAAHVPLLGPGAARAGPAQALAILRPRPAVRRW
jgi:hypothetical protein